MQKPAWLTNPYQPTSEAYRLERIIRRHKLQTVCREAFCPNRFECWSAGTATFLLLGKSCTRNCRFCNIDGSAVEPPSSSEPQELAELVAQLELDHLVLTSVTRDDLADGGAQHWARSIELVRQLNPDLKIEVLVPDFAGSIASWNCLFESRPDLVNHNLETVPRLYPEVRPAASYHRSLRLLKTAADRGFKTKTGLMLGLGETSSEITQTIVEAYKSGVRYLTVGQYLRPTSKHLPVERWVTPGEFDDWRDFAQHLGYHNVVAGPLVRSSYQARMIFEAEDNS